MSEAIKMKKYFEGIEISEPLNYKNLLAFPLIKNSNPRINYITLDEALLKKTAKVTETSESGSVPNLFFINTGEEPVLLVDGEELIGAKQNRILNISVLAPALSKITIKVSCVESGRWHPVSKSFNTSDRIYNSKGRAEKFKQVQDSISRGLGAKADQGEVWRQVDEKIAKFKLRTETSALSNVFENKEKEVKEFVDEFKPLENQIGGIFAINGELIGVEFFDKPITFAKLCQKLIRSYAIDAIEEEKQEKELSTEDAKAFINELTDSTGNEYKQESMGKIVNFKNPKSTVTILDYEGEAVHFAGYMHN